MSSKESDDETMMEDLGIGLILEILSLETKNSKLEKKIKENNSKKYELQRQLEVIFQRESVKWLTANPNAKGLEVPFDTIPKHGMRVRFQEGELYPGRVDWGRVTIGRIVYDEKCNIQKEGGIRVIEIEGVKGYGTGFAGWMPELQAYGRYKHQGNEHCLKILELM